MQLPDGRVIRITRVHLEEDTGRLIHDRDSGFTLVDFNRAGVPLMELVTEPDFRTGEEVRWFGEELQRILRYVGASDADMEKGQMRVEVNISLREIADQRGTDAELRGSFLRESASSSRESAPLGTKVEVKNINSFKFAADAVDYETRRQSALLERGEKIIQETRGWNDHTQETFSQRVKESAHDYRYFPEPDLPPLFLSRVLVEEIRATVPELPAAKRMRFAKEYGLDADSIALLVREKSLADYFEAVTSELGAHVKETSEHPRRDLIKTAVSLMRGDFLRLFRETFSSARDTLITPENFAELAVYFAEDKISNLAAKQILEEMFRTGEDPSDLIEKHGLWQISNEGDLDDIVAHVMKENESAVADVRKGKDAVLQFLVGQVMRESRGKANPQMARELIKKHLKNV